MTKRPAGTPLQVRQTIPDPEPDPNDPTLFNRVARASRDEKVAFDEFLYGLFESKYAFRCQEHWNCPHTLTSHGHTSDKSGKRPIRRLLCTRPDGTHHSFSLARVWYQLPSNALVPKALWPAIKSFSSGGPDYAVPVGDRLTTRPAPLHLIEQAERNYAAVMAKEDRGRLLEDGSPAPLSPRGYSFRKEGEEFLKEVLLRDKRARVGINVSSSEEEDGEEVGGEETYYNFEDDDGDQEATQDGAHRTQRWQTPTKTTRQTTSFLRKLGAPRLDTGNRYDKLTNEELEVVASIVQRERDSRLRRENMGSVEQLEEESQPMQETPIHHQRRSRAITLSPSRDSRQSSLDMGENEADLICRDQPTITVPHHMLGTPTPPPRAARPLTTESPMKLLRRISTTPPAHASPLRQVTRAEPEQANAEEEAPYVTVARRRPAGPTKDVILPPRTVTRTVDGVSTVSQAGPAATTSTTQRVRPLNYTEDERKLIYAGKDPRKTRLTELYMEGLRRARKADIRGALRADGVNTKEIIDIQFVGGGLTSMLIPAAHETSIREQLGRITHFKVLASFDPLDITHMRGLAKYKGKSDEELLVEAKRLAKERLDGIIRRTPTYRKGTKNWYQGQKWRIDHPEASANRAPRERTVADFITQTLAAANESVAESPMQTGAVANDTVINPINDQ